MAAIGCIGRIVRPVDFERTLAAPRRAQSAHFALHHLAQRPASTEWTPGKLSAHKLSTASAQDHSQPVDDFDARWLGLVVPKRHAKRSVTRNLLRRQIRSAADRHAVALPPGLCVVRLKRVFDTAVYTSAASKALGQAVRAELDDLFQRARR